MQLSSNFMVSISGVRGKSPEDLTPLVAASLATAFSRISPSGPIVLSRDSRPHGRELKAAVIAALIKEGREVLDADLIPLPTTQVAVEETGAAGAIDVTASHNPVEWNGLKFLGPDGTFIRQNTLEVLLRELEGINLDAIPETAEEIQQINQQAINWHTSRLLKYAIPGRALTVAVDATNGAGSYIVPDFLEQIDCQVIKLATDPEAPFPHIPEPLPQNLVWTQEKLQGQKFDLCVVVDPDADRLVLIDEQGNLLAEETSVPLVAWELAEQGRTGNVVINMSTSRMTEDIGKKYNFEVIRSAVGEINVVDRMKKEGSFFGGEGGGGIIDPNIHYGRDSLVGIVYVINLMRRTGKTLSQLVAELPHYEMEKVKIEIESKDDLPRIYTVIKKAFPEAVVNEDDGLRLDWETKWVHIRPSNTEPILRIIGEAPSRDELMELIDEVRELVK